VQSDGLTNNCKFYHPSSSIQNLKLKGTIIYYAKQKKRNSKDTKRHMKYRKNEGKGLTARKNDESLT
jgi:hypothetical protein